MIPTQELKYTYLGYTDLDFNIKIHYIETSEEGLIMDGLLKKTNGTEIIVSKRREFSKEILNKVDLREMEQSIILDLVNKYYAKLEKINTNRNTPQ